MSQHLPTAEGVRDLAVEYIRRHRAGCPAPEECGEPLNSLAFWAHCMGLRLEPGIGAEFERLLAGYETRCGKCPHLRN